MSDPTVLEVGLLPILVAIAGQNGVYGDEAPQDAVAPYLIFQRIDTQRDFTLQGATGIADARMQIDAYATGKLQCQLLAGAVRQALNGYLGTSAEVKITACRMENEIGAFVAETDPKLFRTIMDFIISYDEV